MTVLTTPDATITLESGYDAFKTAFLDNPDLFTALLGSNSVVTGLRNDLESGGYTALQLSTTQLVFQSGTGFLVIKGTGLQYTGGGNGPFDVNRITGTVSSAQIYTGGTYDSGAHTVNGGTLAGNLSVSGTQYVLTSGNVQFQFNGTSLPTDVGAYLALLSDNYSGPTISISSILLRQNDVQTASVTLSGSQMVVTALGYTITLDGTFDTSFSAAVFNDTANPTLNVTAITVKETGTNNIVATLAPRGGSLSMLDERFGDAFNRMISYEYKPAADFNGDGKSDLILQNTANGTIKILSLNGNTVTNTQTFFEGTGSNAWVVKAVGDFFGGGGVQVISQHNTSLTLTMRNIWNGVPDGGSLVFSQTTAGYRAIGAGDFNGDGVSELLFVSSDNSGQFAIGAPWDFPTAVGSLMGNSYGLAGIGDFNGDGQSDILLRSGTGQLTVWMMDGTTIRPESGAIANNQGIAWQPRGVGDFNGDGKTDIVMQHTDGTVQVWLMNGTAATVVAASNPGAGWQVMGTGDFDGDGKADIVWENTVSSQILIWTMNGATSTASYSAGGVNGTAWRVANNNYFYAGGVGTSGNDVLVGTTGDDNMAGMDGDDTLRGGPGNDVLNGGNGLDTADFSDATGPVTVNLNLNGTGTSQAVGGGLGTVVLIGIENVTGGDYNDTLTDNGGNNVINGGGGNDTINLNQGGNDTVFGGGGDDTINVFSITGTPTIFGGDGNDTINVKGLTAAYKIDGGAGTNTVALTGLPAGQVVFNADTMTNISTLYLNSGLLANGTISLKIADATVAAGNVASGNSMTFYGAGAASTVSLVIDASADTNGFVSLIGGAGNDTLTGGKGGSGASFPTGSSSVNGGGGNDTLIGQGVPSQVSYYDYTGNLGGVTVSLALQGQAQNTIGQGTDTLTGFGRLVGSQYNDTLISANGGGQYVLSGNGGNDIIQGGGGLEIIQIFDGNHTVDGGGEFILPNGPLNGGDFLIFSGTGTNGISVSAGVTVNLGITTVQATGIGNLTVTNIESLSGSVFNDVLTGDARNNRLYGGGGDDILDGGDGDDLLSGDIRYDYNVALNSLGLAATTTGAFGVTTTGFGNDTLIGGAGFDTAVYSGLRSGYTITRNENGSYTVSGEGTDTLTGIERIQFADQYVSLTSARADFNGDGTSDFLWQNDDGQAAIWTIGGAAQTDGSTVGGNPGPTWHVKGSGDFDGDGKADILWQNDDGQAVVWLMDGLTQTGGGAIGGNPGPTWHVKGSGDFDGDGKADILWQNDDGQAAIWTVNGLTQTGGATVGGNPGPTWHVIAAADFNGDGKSDILWQNDDGQAAVWLMDGLNQTGGATVGGNPGASWHVKGAGDFDGDGKADILWQNDDGQAAVWTMDGLTQTGGATVGGNPGPTWHVIGAGDYSGDGKADILWQNDDGQAVAWTMNGLTQTGGGAIGGNPGNTWHLVSG